MSILSENIKFYRKQNRLTQKELAKILGVAPTAVSAWELGRNNPLMDNVEQMSETFNIKKSVLLGDTVSEFSSIKPITSPNAKNDTLQAINDKVVQLHPERQENVLEYATEQLDEQENEQAVNYKPLEISEPLFEYHVYEKLSAGIGETYWEERNYDTVYFDKEITHDLASWVYGDSMEPKYLDGSIALIKDTGFDYNGAIYAVDWDGQSYIKKVYKEKDGLRLVSLNDKYADKFAPYTEEPRIIGKVVGNFMPMER